ncbi:hypothetical protein LIER_40134 [Lithospermum erythrorhizon]|uniref:Uncharacterized protein n=1 Tax=Lithospermum erythrorhizon TaxID=34254 RepID=A0AAV3QTI4_LITER
MEEMNVISKNPSRKRDRQPISIPFMWEEKPGISKKDWEPSVNRKADDIAAPVKFIASIPFQWEEKPGKPLSCFSHSPVTPLHADIISPLSPSRYSEDDYSSMVDGGVVDTEISNEITGYELVVDEFYSDDSLSASTSLMANCIISTWEISNAIPVEEVQYDKHRGNELQCPPLSPASQADSSTSSYATGSPSLAGNSFLEWFVPLSIPNGDASFNRKIAINEQIYTSNSKNKHMKEINQEPKETAISRISTLGELILMSRRRRSKLPEKSYA